ncbi:hypothetical protein ACFL23_03255 [Patescibacteria group bacterium]
MVEFSRAVNVIEALNDIIKTQKGTIKNLEKENQRLLERNEKIEQKSMQYIQNIDAENERLIMGFD